MTEEMQMDLQASKTTNFNMKERLEESNFEWETLPNAVPRGKDISYLYLNELKKAGIYWALNLCRQ